MFQHLKKKNIYTKIVKETLDYICFKSKFIWNHLYLCLSIASFIWNHLQKYFYYLNITLNYWLICKTIKIRSNFIWKCPLGPWHLCETWFFIFLSEVMTTFKVTSCIFVLRCFNCSNSILPLPFLLHHYIRRYNQRGNSWRDE